MPMGEVTAWNSDKGFGFIRPDDGGEDVFCHVTGLLDGDGSVRQGDQVKFKMSYDDRKGKDRAENVERVGGGGGRSRSRSRGRGRDRGRSESRPRGGRGGGGGGGRGGGGGGGTKQGPGTGEVLRWHGEKGFGFIKPDDGGEDIFCHVSGLKDGEGSVREGDKVNFVVRYDDRKGKDRAEDVEVAGGGGGRGGGRGRDSRSPPPRRRNDSRGR